MADPLLTRLQTALAGQFTIERELGRGGMGAVYLARDERLDRLVAIKVLPPEVGADAGLRERFLREARTAAGLAHPNIVPVHAAAEADGLPYFAMGYVDGEALADRLRDLGRLPAREIVPTLQEVAWALAYAHARGVVHRDVKPENILLDRLSGRAMVTDFGIARAPQTTGLTSPGHVMGTAHYMSPEQVTGEPLDGRSDLYALGVVAFRALSGQLPFDSDNPGAVLVAHATRPAPSLAQVAPDVAPELVAVVDRCLAKAPAERFPSGEALADALGQALEAAERRGAATPADGLPSTLSEAQAAEVWRRAAELQAQAAERLERRTREQRGLAVRSSAAEPTSGYRLRDVEEAAVEAGISRQFVQLALAELPQGLAPSAPADAWTTRVAQRLYGNLDRTIGVSRLIAAAPREVLPALGQTLQGHPYRLQLRETLGGHPLAGGVLVFDIPEMDSSGQHGLLWLRYGIWVKELRVAMRAVPGEPNRTEVTAFVDVQQGYGAQAWSTVFLGPGTGGGLGAIIGAAVAKGSALAGAAFAMPVVAGAALLGVAATLGCGAMVRWEHRRARKEMEALLGAVASGLDARRVFGEPPPSLPPPAGGSSVPFIVP